jgi:large subunit ribosomal protein L34
VKQTFQPNSRKKHKTHGFLVRSMSVGGRSVLSARRKKGRAKIAV